MCDKAWMAEGLIMQEPLNAESHVVWIVVFGLLKEENSESNGGEKVH